MKSLRLPPLAAALALAALGCAAPRPAPEAPPPAAVPAGLPLDGVASNDGTYFVAFAARPSPIPPNAEFALDVSVLSPDRSALVPGVTLAVDATMPEHGHGMNVVPRVTPLGDGRFRVEGLLWHMSGVWEIEFDVTRGAVTERAQTSVEID
jgi:hypothetical protein